MKEFDKTAQCIKDRTGASRVNITVKQGRRRSSVGFAGDLVFEKEIHMDIGKYRVHLIGDGLGDAHDYRASVECCFNEIKKENK